TADSTASPVTPHITADDKAYDGTTSATILTRTLSGAVLGDDVHLSGGTATFSDRNVGVGKTVTGSGFSLTGTDAGNYSLSSPTAATTADITASAATPPITADDKAYDGTTSASILPPAHPVAGLGDTDTSSAAAAASPATNAATGRDRPGPR